MELYFFDRLVATQTFLSKKVTNQIGITTIHVKIGLVTTEIYLRDLERNNRIKQNIKRTFKLETSPGIDPFIPPGCIREAS